MLKVSNKYYSIVAIAFIILCIIGYQLSTTVLLPLVPDAEGANRIVTVPYRAVTLFFTIFLLICTPTRRINLKNGGSARVLTFFWFFYAIRIAFDIYVRGIGASGRFSEHTSTSIFVFAIAIPTFLATLKAFKYVDIHKLNNAMLFSMLIYLGVSLMNNSALMNAEAAESGRISGNAALNTISFGHACLTCAIFIYCYLRSYRLPVIYKNILLATIVLSIFFMFLSGSRGPVVSFVVIIGLYLMGKQKNKIVSVVVLLIFPLLIYLYYIPILHLIGEFAPTFENRMMKTIVENDTSGRDLLYQNALELFGKNPLFGSRYITDYGIYAHNMILDALMGLGIFGGATLVFLCLRIFIVTSKMLQVNSTYAWIGLLCIQQILLNLLSGCFYTNGTLSLLMVSTFYYGHNSKILDEPKQ